MMTIPSPESQTPLDRLVAEIDDDRR